MLKFTDVIYQYEQEKFKFDITVAKGSIVAVLGESGAGKSTLLNLAAGFIRPVSGDILIADRSVINLEPHKRPLAILFQEKNLFSHLNVEDNIGLGLHPGLKLDVKQRQQVANICAQVGISKLLQRFPRELSGGQKQRVALARCFVQNKPLLFLDEPFSALDPILREEMLLIVKELAYKRGVTVLMVTHHLSDALNAASQYIFIEKGYICSGGDIAMLINENQPTALRKFVKAGV